MRCVVYESIIGINANVYLILIHYVYIQKQLIKIYWYCLDEFNLFNSIITIIMIMREQSTICFKFTKLRGIAWKNKFKNINNIFTFKFNTMLWNGIKNSIGNKILSFDCKKLTTDSCHFQFYTKIYIKTTQKFILSYCIFYWIFIAHYRSINCHLFE